MVRVGRLAAALVVPEIKADAVIRLMVSMAGHVAGRKLIASESFTWLDRHFHTTLDQMKTAIDRFLVGGANHIFYHGTAYTPDYVPWPGWLYYASTQVNPRNTIWGDLPTRRISSRTVVPRHWCGQDTGCLPMLDGFLLIQINGGVR